MCLHCNEQLYLLSMYARREYIHNQKTKNDMYDELCILLIISVNIVQAIAQLMLNFLKK
jgi:hypothetical protein